MPRRSAGPGLRAARRAGLLDTPGGADRFGAVTSPSPDRRLKLTLAYDGAAFLGWQVQPGGRTAQSELEAALTRLTARPTVVVAAGRTDRGVHATGQVVSVDVPARWEPVALKRALNAVLPDDIWVRGAADVPGSFHARYSARLRAYRYRVGTHERAQSPFRRRWCWPLREELDRAVLDAGAERLVGQRSFRSFAKAGQEERGDRCTVAVAGWSSWRDVGVEFRIEADRFLHHMVRYLVGTMVDTARGRRPPEDLDRLLAGEPGVETSPPAPPEGLFLTRVDYPPESGGDTETMDEDLP
jgi:tRNA pseudouridine38-40 synthase